MLAPWPLAGSLNENLLTHATGAMNIPAACHSLEAVADRGLSAVEAVG